MKLKITILISILVLLTAIVPANADIMPSGMKGINRCVKITNLDDFPDTVFIGYIRGPLIQCENPYIVTSDKCLTQYYKANNLTIYAMEKDYLDSKELKNIDFESDTNILGYQLDLNPDWDIIDIENPLNEEEIYYSIAGFTDDELVLYESKKVSKYVGSVPDKVKTFEQPEIAGLRSTIYENSAYTKENLSNEHVQKKTINESISDDQMLSGRSIIDIIISFFKNLFGVPN
ncbi:hypothetical protein [Methanolobus sp. ZRKC5]|uniref:hypothetical protein n=1 Tax=unclassified Methanolobus TaxID=2629569 RepID=UPI00313E1F7A